jgi:hypothetical protein
MDRFDDCVRSERYFTATLLPFLLLHDDFAGLRELVDLIESRTASEHDAEGKKKPRVTPTFDYSDPELITEFHIARDLHHYGGTLASFVSEDVDDGPEKRDAPDVVIVLGQEMIVIEGKFFVGFSASDLQAQLRSQKRQVCHLFENRPTLRAWTHVALIPEFVEGLDCDAVITWAEVAGLSNQLLGPQHYVSQRLQKAVDRFPPSSIGSGIRNYESTLSLDQMLGLCEDEGDKIWVGHTGGEANLKQRGMAYALAKRWKWRRTDTAGAVSPANWISGSRFPVVIASLGGGSTAITPVAKMNNYDGVLSFDQMVALCGQRGAEIQVGHIGGASDLTRRGLAYAKGKKWKWRDPTTNKGYAEPANWIPGDKFKQLATLLK